MAGNLATQPVVLSGVKDGRRWQHWGQHGRQEMGHQEAGKDTVQAGACAATLGVATVPKLSPRMEFQASVLTALKMLSYPQGAGRDLSGQPQLVPSWFPHSPAHRKSSQR